MSGKLTKKQFREWGRQGGLLGGNARMKALSKRRRRQIAKIAATARWIDKRNGKAPS